MLDRHSFYGRGRNDLETRISASMHSVPRIRSLQPSQLPKEFQEEQTQYLLRDPAGLSDEQTVVTLPALILLELCDGQRTVENILRDFHNKTGLSLSREDFGALLDRLDSHFLLDNERARTRLSQLDPRPARHAGSAYPAEPAELKSYLREMLGSALDPEAPVSRASILPHIDFFRGHQSYSQGYRSFQIPPGRPGEATTIIILGISHALSSTPFILTKASFDTPLGILETDVGLVEQLAQDLPFDPFNDEYNHIAEHSVEFHAVILKYLLGNSGPVKIVPILCSSFYAAIRGKHSPYQLNGVREFIKNLASLRDQRPDTHFLASVDLAHMGSNFEQTPMNAGKLSDLESQDRETLSYVESGNSEEFFATHQNDGGRRNYCGTPAIFTLLELFGGPFELHHYQQCTDADLASTVSVCSASLRPQNS